MVPFVWGPSRLCTCDRCGQSWRIVAETYSQAIPLTCPNCQLPCEAGPNAPGDQFAAQEIESDAPIRRLQCVIFGSSRLAGDTTKTLEGELWKCKRVWGLPGEEIDFRDGELLINGNLYQKSLAELLEVAVPVCSLPEDRFSYWRFYPKEAATDKNQTNSTSESQKLPEQAARIDRSIPLVWRNGDRIAWCYNESYQQNFASSGDSSTNPSTTSTQPSTTENTVREDCQSVVDDYIFNHSTPRRLSIVDDLLTILQLEDSQTSKDAVLEIRSTYKREQFSFEINLRPQNRQPQEIAYAVVDSQILVSVSFSDGNRDLFKLESGQAIESPITTIELVVKRGQIGAQSLHVLRDLYLQQNERDPANFISSPVRLGANEYFVMGDNLPISIDSRNGLGLVPRQAIQAVLPSRSIRPFYQF